jgi:transposase
MHNFTPEDLIEFYYGELPKSKATHIEKALKTNWSLREKLRVLQEAGNHLNKSLYAPREEVLHKIMAYAKNNHRETNMTPAK